MQWQGVLEWLISSSKLIIIVYTIITSVKHWLSASANKHLHTDMYSVVILSLQCWTMFFWENSGVFTPILWPPTLFQTDAFTPPSSNTPPLPFSTNSCYSRLQCQLTTQEETTWYHDTRTWCREVWFEISRSVIRKRPPVLLHLLL